jgi:plastocyanin
MRSRHLAVLSITALFAAACGGAGGGTGYGPTSPTTPTTPTDPAASNVVSMGDQSFSPGSITVPVSTTVTWKWPTCDATGTGYGGYASCVTHNVTFDDGSNVVSPTQDNGSFTRTFNTAGVFKYHCGIHGSAMSGQVTVK